MGWNTVCFADPNIREAITVDGEAEFYFLHSYYFEAGSNTEAMAKTFYGKEFVSVASFENVIGMQCHPEKSHATGIKFLKYFGTL